MSRAECCVAVPPTAPELKVAVVGPSLGLGGMERATAEISGALSLAGAHVLCVPIFNRPSFMEVHEAVRVHPGLLGDSRRLSVITAAYRLRRILKSNDIDAAVGIGIVASSILALSATGLRMFYAASERSHPAFQWPLSVRALAAAAFFINRPFLWLTQSKYAARQARLRKVRAQRILSIPNIVRTRTISEASQSREPILLLVGRLGDWQKGFDVALDAWSRVSEKGDWRLYIVGAIQGKTGAAQAEELRNFGGRVEVIEATDAIGDWFARAAIFVLPSRGEGFPNALLEAMSAGCAVVSTEYHPGVHELIEHGEDGLVVPSEHPEALARAIVCLMDDQAGRVRLGEAAIKKASRFSPETIGKTLLAELRRANAAVQSGRSGI